ncbi:uncharacterized protein LOC117103379 [Anneissia japonica]|uniref:uncharacterized protein LOC117103379 n=1 Tax=Anneissia japonica TaxID=1529436 RepID=UPI0014256AB8|nr:uncharacterized protein LOC117103379 [Anneissia japonica]
MDDTSNHHTNRVVEMLESFNLVQLVSQSTHVHDHTLNLVITNNQNLIQNCHVHQYHLSDHYIVHAQLDITKPLNYKKKVLFRNFKNIENSVLTTLFSVAFSGFGKNVNNQDVNSMVSAYNRTLNSIQNEVAPEKMKVATMRQMSRWYNDNCRIEKRKCRVLERKWIKSCDSVDKTAFKKQCAKYHSVLTNYTKTAYFQSQVEKCGIDQRLLFSLMNKLCGKSKETLLPSTPSDVELAQAFNTYFHNKIKTFRASLPVISADAFSVPDADGFEISNFTELEENEILNIVKTVSSKTCSLDPFPTKYIIENITVFLPLFCQIVNSSFSSGTFPDDLKVGINHNELANFRPISNTPFLSKLIHI